jgi:phenylacetate-CoA ligase
VSALFRNVVYPFYHWLKRDGVNAAIRELDRNQWLNKTGLLALQRRKLASLLAFASQNVPYYRRLLDDSGFRVDSALSPRDMLGIPVLTKEIIRRERAALISEDLTGNGLIANSTSGSTGEAIRFYTDLRSDAFRKAAGLRSDYWTGWRLGDRHASLWGASIDERRAQEIRGRVHAAVTGSLFLSSFDLSSDRLDEYIERIRRFRPIMLLGYPGPLEQFAIHCGQRGVQFPSIKGIISSAETLWPHQREIIEEFFGIKIFDRYGCRELGLIASECEVHKGMHVSADRVLVEIVDDDGNPCVAGESGKMLITDLDNYGMPLIRYDIGDCAVVAGDEDCTCGRGLPMLESVAGRTLEIVRTLDGRKIGGTFWTLLLRSRPAFQKFQVIQTSLGGVTVDYVRARDFEAASLEYFASKIREHCGTDFTVEFREREDIAPTASGKQRVIISDVPTEANIVAPPPAQGPV